MATWKGIGKWTMLSSWIRAVRHLPKTACPACTRCNRLRWHRTGKQVRELLLIGLVAVDEIKKGSLIGKQLEDIRAKRLEHNLSRRRSYRIKTNEENENGQNFETN